MKMQTVCLSVCMILSGCGGSGGGGDDDDVAVVASAPVPVATPILVTQCGDVTVDISQVPEVVEAAEEEGVEVSDFLDEEEEIPGLNQDGALKSGVIIAACGSTVVNNESITVSNTSTTVTNPADRLIALIRAHEVASIAVHR